MINKLPATLFLLIPFFSFFLFLSLFLFIGDALAICGCGRGSYPQCCSVCLASDSGWARYSICNPNDTCCLGCGGKYYDPRACASRCPFSLPEGCAAGGYAGGSYCIKDIPGTCSQKVWRCEDGQWVYKYPQKVCELKEACPNNQPTLKAGWHFPGTSDCKAYIRKGNTNYQLSTCCEDCNWSGTRLPNGPIIIEDSYELYVDYKYGNFYRTSGPSKITVICVAPSDSLLEPPPTPPPPPPMPPSINCNRDVGYGARVLSADQKAYVWNQLKGSLQENIAKRFYYKVIPCESSWNASAEALGTNCRAVGLYQLEDNTRSGLRGRRKCAEYHKGHDWRCQTLHAVDVYKNRGIGYWECW